MSDDDKPTQINQPAKGGTPHPLSHAAYLLAILDRQEKERRQAAQVEVARFVKALDLLLEPNDAESAIENLVDACSRRLADRKHVQKWLWVQVGWITLNRFIDVLGRVRKAWAGKA